MGKIAFACALVAFIFWMLTACSPSDSPTPLTPQVTIGYTGSMKPTFVGGEVRTVLHIPYSDLKKGDIVETYFSRGWHPHRLVSLHFNRWTTKGDANPVNDSHEMTEETYGGVILP